MRIDADAPDADERIRGFVEAGCNRIIMQMSPGEPAAQWRQLAWFDRLRQRCFG